MNKNLIKYIDLCNRMKEYENIKIPLCAAETYISDFCRKALLSDFEGKYSFVNKDGSDSFIGGTFIEELNKILSDECLLLFNSKYTNADTLTGINCFTICAMSLLDANDYVLITTPEQGGHASIPIILNTLHINYKPIPFNYKEYQIDYDALNELIDTQKYSFIIFCQSDIINPPNLNRLVIPNNVGIIYDGTQTLGLIAGKVIQNPLNFKNVILIGGTHKTLPAPSCGLIMTNNESFSQKLKSNITPNYLRNTQPNHIASLLLALIELEEVGMDYQKKIVTIANQLGKELESSGFIVAKITNNKYTRTHQIFLLMDKQKSDDFYYNAQKYNITLNQKHKKLFNYDGIRLGTQQIARYNWNKNEISYLAKLLELIDANDDKYEYKILELRNYLISRKIPQFKYDGMIIE